MTKFDLETKVWSGPYQPSAFNPEANLGQVIINSLDRNPTKVIQISADRDVYLTCREIRFRSISVAQNMKNMGFKKGDIISIISRNTENLAPIVFGCIIIGATINPLAPTYGKNEISSMLKLTKPVAIFCEEQYLVTVKAAIKIAEINKPRTFVFASWMEVLEETGKENDFFPDYMGDSKELIAAILCSSGTSGSAKGVCLSHAQIISQESRLSRLSSGSYFSFNSIFWSSGFQAVIGMALNGSTNVITTDSFEENAFFNIVEKHKVTTVFLATPMAARLLKSPRIKEANLSSIRFFLIGGSIVPEILKNEINKYLPNGRTAVGYGLTEFLFVAGETRKQKTSSVGVLAYNVKAKIIDEQGNLLGSNQSGEICLKNKICFLGYYNDETTYKKAFDCDHWFYTGDLGYFDDDGYLFIVDRKKDIIKYMGMQISPSEIEPFLMKLEGIKEVCVVGVPDEDCTTDLPAAIIVKDKYSDLDAAKVLEYTNENMADFQKLRGGVFFVDQIPTTPSGKYLRRAIKEYIMKQKFLKKS